MSRLLASLARFGAVALALGFLGWYVLRAQQQAAPTAPTQAAQRTFLASSKNLTLTPLVAPPQTALTLSAASLTSPNSLSSAVPLAGANPILAGSFVTAAPIAKPPFAPSAPPKTDLFPSAPLLVAPAPFHLDPSGSGKIISAGSQSPAVQPPKTPPTLLLSGSKTYVPVVPAAPAKPPQTPSQSPPQIFLPSSKTGIISPISPPQSLELPKPELVPSLPAQPAAP